MCFIAIFISSIFDQTPNCNIFLVSIIFIILACAEIYDSKNGAKNKTNNNLTEEPNQKSKEINNIK